MPPRKRNLDDEDIPWAIVYYMTPEETVPALEFLDSCPRGIDAHFTAVLDAVAVAPPPCFSGGGKWEAMHGEMGGWYEIRLTGPRRASSFACSASLKTEPEKNLPNAGSPGLRSPSSPGCANPGGQCSPTVTTSPYVILEPGTRRTSRAG